MGEVKKLTKYEQMIDENSDLDIVNYSFESEKIKGLYCDGTVALSKSLNTTAEKTCVLAEELGHHYTSVGNILNMNKTNNRKQEHIARMWAYDKLVGLVKLIDAFEHQCQNLFESAEYLNVTEEFLSDTINAYKNKYGNYVQCGDYIITFNPCLGVVKNF